jgi:hypothetical protein
VNDGVGFFGLLAVSWDQRWRLAWLDHQMPESTTGDPLQDTVLVRAAKDSLNSVALNSLKRVSIH